MLADRADAKDDVWNYEYETEILSQGPWIPDISAVRVSHSRYRLRVLVRFHRLSPEFSGRLQVYVDSDTDKWVDYRFNFNAVEPSLTGIYSGGSGIIKVCGLRKTIDWGEKWISMSAPRRCFGPPAKVRVSAEYWEQWELVPGSGNWNWAREPTKWTAKVGRF